MSRLRVLEDRIHEFLPDLFAHISCTGDWRLCRTSLTESGRRHVAGPDQAPHRTGQAFCW
jgi:hypothetical protein